MPWPVEEPGKLRASALTLQPRDGWRSTLDTSSSESRTERSQLDAKASLSTVPIANRQPHGFSTRSRHPSALTHGLTLALLMLASAGVLAEPVTCPAPPLPLEQQIAFVAQAPARNAGFLWRMEKGGRASWLYGTLHINHIDYAKPGPQVMRAMRTGDVLAVEINVTEKQDLSGIPARSEIQLTATQRARLATAYKNDCLPVVPDQLHTGSFQPLLLSQAQRLGLFFGFGPDARLIQIAQRTGKPIVQLETIAQQVAAVAPNTQADFNQSLNSQLDNLESGAFREDLNTVSRAWQTRDWPAFEALERKLQSSHPETAQRLLDQRNKLMAEKIDALHQSGKSVVVAVGALHMAGSAALPELMRQKGYAVNVVPMLD